jgi:hypothetical protein
VNTLERLVALRRAASLGNSRASRESARHGDEAGLLTARATESTGGNSSRSGTALATLTKATEATRGLSTSRGEATLTTMVTVVTAMAKTTAGLGTTSNAGRNGTRAVGTARLLGTTAETALRSTARALGETAGHSAGGLSTSGGGCILLGAELRRCDEYHSVY